MLNVISLGAGVQSSTMALMAAAGEIGPMPDAAIFADTQAEPESVYHWLKWLEGRLPFPVYTVTGGSLEAYSLAIHKSKKSGKIYSTNGVPVFIRNAAGTKGIMPRTCTRNFKIVPVTRKVRELLGYKRMPNHAAGLVVQWMGISSDEEHRAKENRNKWIKHRWPLIELGMNRQDCLDWMKEKGYPTPPRSACVFCPYHHDLEWIRLKDNEPKEFEKAVQFEKKLQSSFVPLTAITATPFLHSSLVPLDEVKFNRDSVQIHYECEGMCGV